ncbi:MAG: DUF4835 family protein [Prolixibacteraceae bacterium]|jgi:hypothetical protein|nr:DUF4835 family protein [Prolixibacteraceae bacterium]MBT6004899.1 DUF4835 family protein [Prolixibacteraceae bacterium]MBT6767060.1 DUF4835 family protein [Prolixibacteraceae bacterium]MBT6997419.1 DUF4835 family protein [Prolixibacteraceae bacterium]MBT7396630.1 DUF4835 family protein [Prolixibacteraceae bacterium]
MKKSSVFIILILFLSTTLFSQELRCNITVSSQKIQGANQNLFRTMQSDLYEFVNNRKWTDHVYTYDEKIRCNILIRLEEQISSDEFKGTMQVQLTRPVFNSSYETTILNIKDNDFHCRYVEFQPLEFNETSNRDNLTNILAFYAYIILGFDYDTFSPEGGTPYFEKAQAIVNNSQNAREKGWKAFESERNRYWLIENILNKSYSDYRNCMYNYHRNGLDLMSEKPEEGRAVIADSMRDIQKVFRRRPSIYILQMFFDSKSDELVNIFSKSFPDERNRVMAILNEVDPSNGSKYEKIAENEGF